MTIASVRADDSIASAQQKLKEQGFYYGEVSGQKNADTVAAIRRYQIRNGLAVNGELDAETQKSIGVRATASVPKATPVPTPASPRITALSPSENQSNGSSTTTTTTTTTRGENSGGLTESPDGVPTSPEVYAPGPRGLRPETSGVFDGTPFEIAPPAVQRQVTIGAQTLLARRGFYRSGIDGVYGPGTEFAVRSFQARVGIEPSGRLDLQTLAALGLLPGQRRPGFINPPRRFVPSPREPVIRGEWVPEE